MAAVTLVDVGLMHPASVVAAVNDRDLEIDDGRFMVFVGPSGRAELAARHHRARDLTKGPTLRLADPARMHGIGSATEELRRG